MRIHYRGNRFSLVAGCCLLASISALPVGAAPLELKTNGEKTFRAGGDTIEIQVGDELPSARLPYLRFEIDSIDVTDFVQRSPSVFKYTPEQPLTPGMHELRVVVALPNGAIEEAANWKFEIRFSEKYRVAEINKQVNLVLMQRLSTDFPEPLPAATQGQGAGEFSSRHENGDWTLNTKASVLYNSDTAQNLSGEELDLPDYQIKADWKQNSVVLGHQVISPGSLILNEFNRRGISASHRSKQNRVTMTGFATRTEEITGFRNITGVESADNRAAGVILTSNPIENKPQALGVTLIALDSKGISQGVAQVDDNTSGTGGAAQAVIVDSYQHNSLWHLRGEHAATSFDFDGLNTGFSSIEDNASSVQINYDTTRDTSGALRKGGHWNATVGKQRTGAWFFSQANTAATPDRDMTQLSGGYQGNEFGMNASFSFGEDNVARDTTLPITAINAANLNLVYTPQPTTTQQNGETGQQSKGLFSNPSYSLSYVRSGLDQIYKPGVFTGDDVNLMQQELMLAATSSGADWNWTLSQSFIQQDDLVNTNNTASTVSTSLEATKTLNKYVTVAPVLQRSFTKNKNLATETTSSVYGVTANLSYPKNWINTLSYTENRDYASDGSIDSTTQIAQLMVQYQKQHSVPGKIGISYFGTASHQHTESGGVATNGYQLFVGMNIAWPAP